MKAQFVNVDSINLGIPVEKRLPNYDMIAARQFAAMTKLADLDYYDDDYCHSAVLAFANVLLLAIDTHQGYRLHVPGVGVVSHGSSREMLLWMATQLPELKVWFGFKEPNPPAKRTLLHRLKDMLIV